jgi:hypothetical protein
MVIRFARSVGQVRRAVATCLARRRSIASRLRRPPSREGKSGPSGSAVAFAHPDPKHGDGLGRQRRDSFLPSLADCANVRADAELHVGAGERQHLGDPQSGLHGSEQQRVVASPGPGRPIRSVQQGLHLLGGEEGDGSLLSAFRGDREHPLDQGGVLGVAQRAVLKERVDRGEANVARPGAVAALALEVLKERSDRGRVELRELKPRWRVPVFFCTKASSGRNASR